MSIEGKALARLRETAREEVEAYVSRTNQIVGVSAFGLALSCVGLKLPAPYAILGLLFTVLLWSKGSMDYRPYIAALRRAGDPKATWWAILWRSRIAFIGSLFLGLVALGFVGT